ELTNKPSGMTISDYNFAWFTGNSADTTYMIPGATTNILSNLDPGVYTAVAVQTFGDQCPGNPLSITIEKYAKDPVLATTVTSNDACDPSAYNGQIEITASKAEVTDNDSDGYQFVLLLEGVELESTGSTTGIFAHTFTDLAPEDYVVRITNIYSNCSIEKPYTVADDPFMPAIDITQAT